MVIIPEKEVPAFKELLYWKAACLFRDLAAATQAAIKEGRN